jgi:hypothetical protein
MTPEENLARITEEVNEQMRRFGYILPETNARLLDAQTGISNFDNKVQLAAGAVGRLSDVVGDYTRRMYEGEKGAQTFNKGLYAMADGVTFAATALSLLIPGSRIMKGVYAAFTFLAGKFIQTGVELTETAVNQNNIMFETFNRLAKSGAAGADGVEGLTKDFQDLGLSLLDMDNNVRLLGDNAADLALLGGSVRKGVKEFAALGLGMSQYEENLRKLGLNEKEQADAAMRFAKMQSRLSLGQQQDYGKLADSAYKFIREQDALTKITGLNAKQQQDTLDEAMSNQRYAAVIDELTRQEKHEEVKQLQDRLIIAKKLGQEKGFQDIVSGFIGTEASRQYNMLTQGQGMRETEDIKAGRFVNVDSSGKRTRDEAGFAASIKNTLQKTTDTFDKLGPTLGRVGVFDETFGRYSDAAKSKQMNENFGPTTIRDAKAEADAQIAATKTVVANNAELFKEQNNLMILEQKFIGEHLPNIFADAMTKVVTEFTKKLNEFGTGLTNLEVSRARQSRAAALSTTVPPAQAPRPGDTQPGPVGPGNPRQQRDADTLPPWSQTNPLPVIIQPPVPPIVIPDQTTTPPRPPRYGPLIPPPIPARADGTSGEIGKLFEPKDIIAQLHRGERVLNRDENTDLTKLFGMVTGDRSKNKMTDPQGEMLKVIDNITSGMKTKAKPDANKGFDAAYADISSGMMNTGPAQQALIDSQGAILKQIDSFKTNAMPTTANTGALLGAMPSLEIDKEAAEQISQSFKETMGDEFKSAVTNISKFAEQMQRGGDQGLQQQMVGLLEEMRRSMQATAKASERLAQVASN